MQISLNKSLKKIYNKNYLIVYVNISEMMELLKMTFTEHEYLSCSMFYLFWRSISGDIW